MLIKGERGFVKNPIQNKNYKKCGDDGITAGRGGYQTGWYGFISRFCHKMDVLDVGCGTGVGIDILSKTARKVNGIDVDYKLQKENIEIKNIAEVNSKSYDIVTAVDVIEHIEEDINFIKDLIRVARHKIFITTPNYTASRCSWPYHVREYMPHQLVQLFQEKGSYRLYKGSCKGDEVYKVQNMKLYYFFNKSRVFPLTAIFAKCINNVVPRNLRIHSSLCLEFFLT